MIGELVLASSEWALSFYDVPLCVGTALPGCWRCSLNRLVWRMRSLMVSVR